MPYFGSSILESIDKSTLSNNFKKKSNKPNFEIIKSYNTISKYIKGKKYHYRLDGINEDLESEVKEWIKQNRKAAFIINTDDNDLIGFVAVRTNGAMSPIFVYPKYRGYGFSEDLMNIAVNEYGANCLGVYTDNKVALKLYEKYGFKQYSSGEDSNGKYYGMRR